jgi:heme A synthase
LSDEVQSGPDTNTPQSGRLEALKTFIEQTKLLVSLASGFILAPPAVLTFLRKPDGHVLFLIPWKRFLGAEGLLIASILAGYVVLGTIAGSQHTGDYDVHRTATRVASVLQLVLYLAGIIVFLSMTKAIL